MAKRAVEQTCFRRCNHRRGIDGFYFCLVPKRTRKRKRPAARTARFRLQAFCMHKGAIRSGTRYAKWAEGSRSQTHRRAAMCGFAQGDGYVRGVAPTHDAPRTLPRLLATSATSSRRRCVPKTYRYRYCANTVYVTVSRVNAYSGGVLARALPEGLRYLST